MHKRYLALVLIAVLIVIAGFASFSSLRNSNVPDDGNRPTPVTTAGVSVPESSHSASMTTVKLFLVALEDGGKSGKKIGCGDSLVPVTRTIPSTSTPLRGTYQELFSLHDRFYGQSGLYNSLYQSNLQIQNVTIDANGHAHVSLTGTYTLGGECDNPRFQEQLQAVALQFPSVKAVTVTINGKTLDEIVSQR